jgi:hypothetical protein
VWCGVVWCGVVWCGVVWCGVVWNAPCVLLSCPAQEVTACKHALTFHMSGLCTSDKQTSLAPTLAHVTPAAAASPPSCSSKELDTQHSWALAALLNSSTGARGLTSLSLVNQPLGDLGITSICRAASYSSCLLTLSLKGSSVGDQVRSAPGAACVCFCV